MFFRCPRKRNPARVPSGAVEVLLADRSASVDFICDGVHVDPVAIRLALAAKGAQKVVAITDSNIGAGLDEGVYPTPWGYPVRVSNNDAARVHDSSHPLHGQLAGSSLTMNRAVSNLLGWLDRPEHEIWAMATCNPARTAGLDDVGVIDVGADANLVLWGDERGVLQAVRTWVRGVCVYERESVFA